MDITEEKYYKGYYCIKCKYIPLIQIIKKGDNLFILSLCHCNKKYQKFDIFHKNFYQEKIPINNIHSNPLLNIHKEIKEDDILLVYKIYKEIKNKIRIYSKKILENLNVYIKEKKQEQDELKNQYEQYMEINNKMISIIENFFFSYQLVKENSSIKLNIINICFNKEFYKRAYIYLLKLSPDIHYQNSLKFFQDEFIISETSLEEQLNHKFFKSQNNSVLCFIELDNQICVSNVKNNPNIFLYKIENKQNKFSIQYSQLSIKAHLEKIIWIIKIKGNHLISYGTEGYIKIWPSFDENLFLNIENNTNLEISPLYQFHLDIQEKKDIQKLININENSFLAFSGQNIFLFNYIINDKEIKIDLIKTSKNFDSMIDLILIKRKNKDSIIAAYNKNELYIINIINLEIIKNIKLNNTEEKNCIVQLTDNEIIIVQNNGDLLVLDIEYLLIKLKFNSGASTDYLYKLKDGTLIQSGVDGMRRIIIKNFQELPILYTPYKDTEFDHPYKVYEKITCLNQLSDGYIIKCVVVGTIFFCELKFI